MTKPLACVGSDSSGELLDAGSFKTGGVDRDSVANKGQACRRVVFWQNAPSLFLCYIYQQTLYRGYILIESSLLTDHSDHYPGLVVTDFKTYVTIFHSLDHKFIYDVLTDNHTVL